MKNRKTISALVAVAIVGGSLFSTNIVNDIKQHEGVRTEAYKPLPPDRPTIAAGSTFHPDGSPVKMGDKITREQVGQYILYDINRFTKEMDRCIKVPLSENEFRAIYSWTMNVGSANMCRSTLVRKLNSYDYSGACAELNKWVFFQGKRLKGLENRRAKEYQLCMTP
jgi:lysozyme